MVNWKSFHYSLQHASDEKGKRLALANIRRLLERASSAELKEIQSEAEDEFIRQHAELELWWRDVEKEPDSLLKSIQTSDDKKRVEKAITELGNIKYPDAVDIIAGYLNDIDLRDSAALALRQMPSQKVFIPLLHAIKQHPDGAECLLYALQVLDCSDAAEYLVELFISKPNALVVRDDIYVCFFDKAVKQISKKTKEICCAKLLKAIECSPSEDDIEELKKLYAVVLQIEES